MGKADSSFSIWVWRECRLGIPVEYFDTVSLSSWTRIKQRRKHSRVVPWRTRAAEVGMVSLLSTDFGFEVADEGSNIDNLNGSFRNIWYANTKPNTRGIDSRDGIYLHRGRRRELKWMCRLWSKPVAQLITQAASGAKDQRAAEKQWKF